MSLLNHLLTRNKKIKKRGKENDDFKRIQRKSMGYFEKKIYWNTGKVSRGQIETVLSRPWTADGRTFSERIWMDKDALIDEVYKQLTRSVLLGKGPNDAVNAIAKRCQASQYNAGRLVFTESAYIAAEADKQVYKELSVEQFEVDAALDGETCALCGEMDGKHFPMSEYQSGLNAPPFHPNCRCTTVPYFDDDIQERLDKKVGRAARNSGTGKTERVENMTYPEWKEKYVDNDRDSGIIREASKKNITYITDKVIENVPVVNVPGYTDKQCKFIQQQHKELLKFSKDENASKEVAFVFRSELTERNEYKGTEDKVDFGTGLFGKGSNLFIMHNHPKNSGFSDDDMLQFIADDNIKTLSIVKNNGDVEVITKDVGYSAKDVFIERKRYKKKYIIYDTDKEYTKYMNKLLKRLEERKYIKWIR